METVVYRIMTLLDRFERWFNDRFGTLLGIRGNETYKRTPNITPTVTAPPLG